MDRVVIEIEQIPIFLERYMNQDPKLESLIHTFCKYLLFEKPVKIIKNTFLHGSEDKPTTVTLIDTVYSIKDSTIQKFCDFYFDKSKMDNHFLCKYEDELNISKSLYNECFYITIKDGTVYRNGFFYLDTYEEDGSDKFLLKEVSL